MSSVIHLSTMSRCVLNGVFPDTELARTYELAINSQFVPLGIYTLGVDYTDVDVQVNGGRR